MTRRLMRRLAAAIDRVGRGRVTPDMVTLGGAALHVPIAVLIALGHLIPAAVLLAVTLPLDVLDGELARLQGRAGVRGMLLDATSDRLSEAVIYCGIAYWLDVTGHSAVWAVMACGAALSVSYIKAKGEAALATAGMDHDSMNRLFQVGVASLTNRKRVLVVGLLIGQVWPATVVVVLLSLLTVRQRWVAITRHLSRL
ncbi:CDP-alcohol phosphatidyltransferase family protein [Sphaerisporangium aureirubrum]|uniref:CDP-alcohol phosphatidyltransferase family protein n=1 Tax=Sphaerisporangium aureirubrum TaxID=1544736 RepID=A0ABW1NS91_9ACTN